MYTMLCEKCGKNVATYHSSINVDGSMMETHYCEKCAKEENMNFSIGNFFDEMQDNSYVEPAFGVCPICNCSYEDFRRTGLLGCANCYLVFKDRLQGIIQQMQGSLIHHGKTPCISYEPTTDELIASLKQNLRDAVEVEDYELAAKIKKDIDNIKRGE